MQIENLSKTLIMDNGFQIKLFEKISFDIPDNAITSLIAPKGSGKSTLLKIIAGLEVPDSAASKIDGVVYLSSEPSSFPWLNAEHNIKFGKNDLSNEKIKDLCSIVGLEGYESHYPNNKSLGFRFRISLARALALTPTLIVIDEPFNFMESITRFEIYQLILDINSRFGTTFLFATANIAEAIILSSKIYLLKEKPLVLFKSIDCDLTEKEVSERLNSPKYAKCLSAVQNLIQSHQDRQLFTISI